MNENVQNKDDEHSRTWIETLSPEEKDRIFNAVMSSESAPRLSALTVVVLGSLTMAGAVVAWTIFRCLFVAKK